MKSSAANMQIMPLFVGFEHGTNFQHTIYRDWKDGSAVKNTCLLWQRTRFHSQPPHGNSHLTPSSDLCEHCMYMVHMRTLKYTHIQ